MSGRERIESVVTITILVAAVYLWEFYGPTVALGFAVAIGVLVGIGSRVTGYRLPWER